MYTIIIITEEKTYTMATTDTFDKARFIADAVAPRAMGAVWVYKGGEAWYRAV